jgi:xanthine dehydrogenase small subunit
VSSAGTVLLNDRPVTLERGDVGLVLAWLRGARALPGTKEGCGEGECGACAVLLGEPEGGDRLRYRAVASCLLPVAELAGRHLVTIEGLDPPHGLTPVQQALVDAGAPQCGFCFPGIVVALTGFLLGSEDLSPGAAITALDGNICRCTGYASIRRAVARLCAEAARRLGPPPERLPQLVAWGVVPGWFTDAAAGLRSACGAAAPVAAAPVATASVAEDDGAATVVAGGTDLVVQRPDLLEQPALTLLSRRPGLTDIGRDGDHLVVGGGATIADLGDHPLFRQLVPAAPAIVARFASTLIRNRATVAGNLVNASPIGDLTVLLLALDAGIVLVGGPDGSPDGSRVVPLADFYRGYKQLDLAAGELVECVRVPLAVADADVSFEKVSQRHILDIASVNSALRLRLDPEGVVRDLTLAVGGVAPVPLVARETAATLRGRVLDAAAVREAGRALDAEIAPIDDVRGTAAYKRELARRLLFAHALTLAPDRVHLEELA